MSPSQLDTPPEQLDPKEQELQSNVVDNGEFLTTNQGLRMNDDQNSLRVGPRGPTLLEDFHFREKITHFDHERIPERVVHARGSAAHGYFQAYRSASDITKASFLQDPSKQTPVFLRFSTVAGSRGSADTPRDVRGFAVKFYTDEGVWDMVGNNMPVFFIQDAIKFPDFVHSVKPEPHNEIPQAQSAHDTFWDFVSLTPESTHMLMWVMSDRALPRSFSMMEGFGIHSYRFVNAEGKSHFVKFHFKPAKGIHSLVWDEAQKISGKDPDFNRRDLWESIERGDFPEWEFGVQVVNEEDEHKFDFDILDPTKIIPEELVPVRILGKLVLNRNPDNFFAETEQAAFHPGHVVPGIDFSDDPLLQGRLFSYLDTQLLRVGPNFPQIPINRTLAPVHNNQRDARGQMNINKGRVSYFPNSLAGGCPMHSPDAVAAFKTYPERVEGNKVRERSTTFSDHFSQATLFWNSMASWEKKHIVEAFSFELNMLETKAIQERVVNELLVNVADELAQKVAANVGVKVTATPKKPAPQPGKASVSASPALSMDKPAASIKGRKVAILAADGVTGKHIADLKQELTAAGAMAEVIAKHAGTIHSSEGEAITVDRAAPNATSVIYDAVFIPGGKSSVGTLAQSGINVHFINEAFAHYKTIGACGEGIELLKNTAVGQAGLGAASSNGKISENTGVVTGQEGAPFSTFFNQFKEAMAKHRHFDRQTEMVPA
jgi:catalase